MDLATLVGAHYARRWFLPTPLRAVFVVASYRPSCVPPYASWLSLA